MHMTISFGRKPDATKVEIDGTDITRHILKQGFAITPTTMAGPASVTMTLIPDSLTVDGEIADVPEPLQVLLGQVEGEQA